MSIPSIIAARALLIRVSDRIGFPAPRPDQGLAEWASNAAGITLLQGSEGWKLAHAATLAALEAALFDSETLTAEKLTEARGHILAFAKERCRCDAFGRLTVTHPRNVKACARCGLRVE